MSALCPIAFAAVGQEERTCACACVSRASLHVSLFDRHHVAPWKTRKHAAGESSVVQGKRSRFSRSEQTSAFMVGQPWPTILTLGICAIIIIIIIMMNVVIKQSALQRSAFEDAVKALLNARVADGKIIRLRINNKTDKVGEFFDQNYEIRHIISVAYGEFHHKPERPERQIIFPPSYKIRDWC